MKKNLLFSLATTHLHRKSRNERPSANHKTLRPFFVMGKQTSRDGTWEVWEVRPLLRPLSKLEKEKYENLDCTLLSMLKTHGQT